jgi:hypothetical protein
MGSATHQLFRAQDVNFGDRTPLKGAERKTLAWMNQESAGPFTVYATATLRAPAGFTGRVVPMVSLEWGHGGATVSAERPIVGRLRVPLAASIIKLEGHLVDMATGAPPPIDVTAEIAAFIASGTDGETILQTETLVAQGDGGTLATNPQRVLAVEGHTGGIGAVYVMLFDAPVVPPDGATPRLSVFAPSVLGGSFSRQLAAPRDFVSGIAWAPSITPLRLTRAVGATLHVEVDLLA